MPKKTKPPFQTDQLTAEDWKALRYPGPPKTPNDEEGREAAADDYEGFRTAWEAEEQKGYGGGS